MTLSRRQHTVISGAEFQKLKARREKLFKGNPTYVNRRKCIAPPKSKGKWNDAQAAIWSIFHKQMQEAYTIAAFLRTIQWLCIGGGIVLLFIFLKMLVYIVFFEKCPNVGDWIDGRQLSVVSSLLMCMYVTARRFIAASLLLFVTGSCGMIYVVYWLYLWIVQTNQRTTQEELRHLTLRENCIE